MHCLSVPSWEHVSEIQSVKEMHIMHTSSVLVDYNVYTDSMLVV